MSEQHTKWRPMETAPRQGVILLKVPIEGGHWPVVGRYNPVHGGFCLPAILGQLTELQLFPVAWLPIEPFDTDVHANREAAA